MTESINLELQKLKSTTCSADVSTSEATDNEQSNTTTTSTVSNPIWQSEATENETTKRAITNPITPPKTSAVQKGLFEQQKENPTTNNQSPQEKTGDVSKFLEKSSVEKLEKKKIRLPKVSVTKAEVEKAKQFLLKSAQELGIDEEDINSLTMEQKTLYIALALAYEKGQITKEDFAEIAKKHGEQSISEKIKELYPDGTVKEDSVRAKKLEHQFQLLQKFHTICYKKCASNIYGSSPEETKQLRDKYWISLAKDTEKYQQKLYNLSVESLPKDCSENVANEITDASMTYAKTVKETFLLASEKSGCSKEGVAELKNTIDKTDTKIQENYISFKEKFWNSPKGQAIKTYTKWLYNSYLAQKEECEEKEQEALEKQEEADAAEKEAEKAQEEADRMKANADAVLANYNVDNLPEEKQEKLLQRVSTRAFLQKKWADADLKKAQDVQYDAESAKRLANKFLEYAQKQMAYMEARIAIIRSSIRTFC